MAENDLSQEEGDALIAMDKVSTSSEPVKFPDFGGRVEMSFVGTVPREEFVVSFRRSSIDLSNRNHHLRGRRVIGLARLDLDGPPHRNPDGLELGRRHLHIYREGFGLKYAVDVPQVLFRNLDDPMTALEDFLRYCRVVTPPAFDTSLFR